MLIKYQNNCILTILAPKWLPSTALPWAWISKTHFFFYFSNSFLDIVLPKGDFMVVWGDFLGRNVDQIPKYIYFEDFCPKMWPFTGLPWSWCVNKSLCFAFTIVSCILCCPKMIFWWFGRIYWGEILIKYKIPIFWPFLPQNAVIFGSHIEFEGPDC